MAEGVISVLKPGEFHELGLNPGSFDMLTPGPYYDSSNGQLANNLRVGECAYFPNYYLYGKPQLGGPPDKGWQGEAVILVDQLGGNSNYYGWDNEQGDVHTHDGWRQVLKDAYDAGFPLGPISNWYTYISTSSADTDRRSVRWVCPMFPNSPRVLFYLSNRTSRSY